MTCDIQYSGAARALVAGSALATMALVLATPVEPRWQVLALLWVLLVSCHALRRLGEVLAVQVDEDGAIAVLERGRWLAGRVLPGCLVLPWLTVIRWRPAGRWFARSVFLLPPLLAPDVFRSLRVALRWGRTFGETFGDRP